jgi:hypothetical protein
MKNIETCLELNTAQVLKYIEEHMDVPHYQSQDNYLYYPSNEANLLLCAHVDTVRKEDKPLIVKRNKNVITSEGSVLGADDRAGVWALLEIRRRCIEEGLKVPALLFTNYEESGGTGMVEFVKAKKKYFKYIHLAVAMDRAGANEYVTYNHLPQEVSRYMESFGYVKGCGTFNDITYFTEEYRIPSVNVSVGYYNAHTVKERLHYDELLFSIGRVMEIIKDPIGKRYKTNKEDFNYSNYDYCYEWYGFGDKKKEKRNGKNRNRKGGNGNIYIPEVVNERSCEDRLCTLCEDSMGTRYVDEHDYTTWLCDECFMWVTRDNPDYQQSLYEGGM